MPLWETVDTCRVSGSTSGEDGMEDESIESTGLQTWFMGCLMLDEKLVCPFYRANEVVMLKSPSCTVRLTTTRCCKVF